MTALADLIADRIRRDGPLPFAAYMSLALYHPRFGYYASADERLGWRGHFVTSSELDPAYGILWGRAFESLWIDAQRPDEFVVVEIGPGSGAFAAAVIDNLSPEAAKAIRYVLVERMARARERQAELLGGRNVTWVGSIDELPAIESGCAFLNEILDNLPVHLVERDEDGIHELCVDLDGDGLSFRARPPTSPELIAYLDRAGITLPVGHRAEVALAAESMVRHVGARLESGTIAFVDYGITGPEASTRPGGTLACYSEQGVDDAVLERPGSKDITAHAPWTAIANVLTASGFRVSGPETQRAVLKRLGSDEIDASLRDAHESAVREGRGGDAVRALSRRQAIGVLVDPNGLGGLEVVAGTKGVPPPTFLG
ncbi:MAG TPA: SAM-dependent methyltransferase [Actinomycetota bacterium]|nr:SAM-dependent methyltransferase [Actinomycetota bacterium]